MKNKRLYIIWKNMRQRCNNANCPCYKYYGAKGVKICKEWNNFEFFQKWALENGYKEKLTIERKNVFGNYEPSNCEWIPFKLQLRNRTDTPKITYKGETKAVIEWAEQYGISTSLIRRRLRLGWDLDRIFNEKPFVGKNQYFVRTPEEIEEMKRLWTENNV